MRVTVDTSGIPDKLFERAERRAELWLANAVLKDTRPYVPALTESFSNRAHIEDGDRKKVVVYPGPYARYLYYGKVMKGPKTGPKYATDKNLVFTKTRHPQAQAFWFEASKAQNLERWKRGAVAMVRRELAGEYD